MRNLFKPVAVLMLLTITISLSAGMFAAAGAVLNADRVNLASFAEIPAGNIDINKGGTVTDPYGKEGASMVTVNVTGIIWPETDNLVVSVDGVFARYYHYDGQCYFAALIDNEVSLSDITIESAAAQRLILGDVNFSQELTSTDMNLLKGLLAGNRFAADNFEYIAADINRDLSVTSTDMNWLKGVLAGNLILPTTGPGPAPTEEPEVTASPSPIPTSKTTVLYSENFERYDNNAGLQSGSGWSVPVQTNLKLGTNSTKYAEIVQNSASYAQVTFDPAPLKQSAGESPGRNAKIIAEYRIARASFNHGNTSWIAFTDSAAARGQEGLSAAARMDNLSNNYPNANVVFGYGNYFSSGGYGPVILAGENSSATTGVWVRVRYEVKITDDRANYITPEVSAFINDSPSPAAGIGSVLNLASNDKIDALRICTSSSTGGIYVDDISVRMEAEEALPPQTIPPTPVPTENPGWVYVNEFGTASGIGTSRFQLTASGWNADILTEEDNCLELSYSSGQGGLESTFAPMQLLTDAADGVTVDSDYNSVTAEFDLKTENLTGTALIAFSKVWAEDDGAKISTFKIDGSGAKMFLGKDETNQFAYEDGKWHHVRLEFVGKNAGSDSVLNGGKQQKLWIDGELVAGPVDMDSTSNSKVSQLAKMSITLPSPALGAKVYIDNIVIKREAGGFVPPVIDSVDNTRNIGINVYNKDVAFDIHPKFEMGKIWVSAQSVAEAMGYLFYDIDGGFVLKNDNKTVTAFYGEYSVSATGEEDIYTLAPYRDGIRSFIPLDTLMYALDSSYTWSAVNNKATVKAPVLPTDPPLAAAGQITSKAYGRDITYRIPHQNPDAKVTVWRKESDTLWRRLYTPVYDGAEGAFVGTVAQIGEQSTIVIKVKIEDGAEVTSFRHTTARTVSGKGIPHQNVLYNPSGLLLVPTFNNIGAYINCSVFGAINTVRYRRVGDSQWKQALALAYDDQGKQFRGSIVGLSENTQYEVNVRITDSQGNLIKEETAVTTTWKETVPVAQEINVRDIYTPGEPLVLQNIHGTPDGYIKITGDEDTVISVTDEYKEAVFVAECSYVIIENLTIKGGQKNGMTIAGGTNNIRITNCDISGWGRAGTFNVARGLYLTHTGGSINNDAAININDVSKTVIEKCYFHDPKGKSNAWRGPNREWDNVHPEGPNGIYGRGKDGVVVRYNDFVGSDEHRWNDSFETYHNFEKPGGPGYDSDIYGNYQVFGQDDSTEMDGNQMNLRYYGNKVEGFLCGVSTAANVVGPSYIFKNLIINMGDEILRRGSAIKNGHADPGISIGLTYFFHNTMAPGGTGIAKTNTYYRPYSRNNILDTNSSSGSAIAFQTYAPGYVNNASPASSADYDLHYGNLGVPSGNGANSIRAQASFVNRLAADFRLAAGSAGIDKGQLLPNFSDGYQGTAPDMGAAELGEDALFPIRPVDIRADKYQLNLSASKPTDTVTFTIRDIPEGMTYKILTNEVFDKWMKVTVQGDTGTLTPNSTLTVTVTADIQGIGRMFNGAQFARGNGAFLLKLGDGHSIPITVYAAR